MLKITKRQSEALQVIDEYINEKGFAPTIRELMEVLDLRSPSSVKGLLDALRRKKYVTWKEGLPRTIKIIKKVHHI